MKRNHNKYVVLKVSDIMKTLNNDDLDHLQRIIKQVEDQRSVMNKQPMKCVVVEEDWPMYEQTWKAIEDWVDDETGNR